MLELNIQIFLRSMFTIILMWNYRSKSNVLWRYRLEWIYLLVEGLEVIFPGDLLKVKGSLME